MMKLILKIGQEFGITVVRTFQIIAPSKFPHGAQKNAEAAIRVTENRITDAEDVIVNLKKELASYKQDLNILESIK